MSRPDRGPARYAPEATTAGGYRRSRARSTDVTRTAQAPSTSMVQSSGRNGSTTKGDARYSSRVRGLRGDRVVHEHEARDPVHVGSRQARVGNGRAARLESLVEHATARRLRDRAVPDPGDRGAAPAHGTTRKRSSVQPSWSTKNGST